MELTLDNQPKPHNEGEEQCIDGADCPYELRLYVAGQTPRSLEAGGNLKKICEEHLKGKYTIAVIDLLENPRQAKGDQILAIPTLVRRRFLSCLDASTQKRVICMQIHHPEETSPPKMRELTREELSGKIRALEERPCESEQTIQAIRGGEVDAVIIRLQLSKLYASTFADTRRSSHEKNNHFGLRGGRHDGRRQLAEGIGRG